MKLKKRKVVQILYDGQWVTLKELCIEDKRFLLKKHPELKIYFKRKEIEEEENEKIQS